MKPKAYPTPQPSFDPYHRWLGVPAGFRPPTYYQLLGITASESDPEVIHSAALRQSAYVRNFQAGPHAEVASRILSELAEARAVLTDPTRRMAYDARLAELATTASSQPYSPPSGTPASRDGHPLRFDAPARSRRRPPPTILVLTGVGAGLLVLAACGVVLSRSSHRPSAAREIATDTTHPQVVPAPPVKPEPPPVPAPNLMEADAVKVEEARKPAQAGAQAAEATPPPPPESTNPGLDANNTRRAPPPLLPSPPKLPKPRRVPVYKVVFPGGVLLTTNEQEVKNIVKVYPGEFKGGKGHWAGPLGYAYADQQEGTVLLRRYLVGSKRVFTTRKVDNPNYKEEGMGAWVLRDWAPGTSLQLGFFRKKDAAMEYGPESVTDAFGRLGYRPSELQFYLFDRPATP